MSTSTTLLKQLVGDAGAGQDQSHGTPTARDVMEKLALGIPPAISAFQAAVSAAVVGALVVEHTGRYDVVFTVNIGTAGTANDTVADVQVNGTPIDGSEITIANDDADGTTVRVEIQDVLLTQGDVVLIEVTAAATDGALATYCLYLKPVRPE
jgi:hypothetical protein